MVMQPNIWLQKDPVDGVERRCYRFTYGNNGMLAIVYGKLYEKDFGMWLHMLDMARRNDYKKIESPQLLTDIAKEMGYKNPYKETYHLHDTFDRLLDVRIRIKPEEGRGFTAAFSLT